MSTPGTSRDADADELVRRARLMRGDLRKRQAETEELTHYPVAMHEAFAEAGFYRILTPRRYGGLELDYLAFVRVVTEIAKGCMSTGWGYALGHGHALQAASYFGEQAQDEAFRDPDFVAAGVAAPSGTAVRDGDGWRVTAAYRYASGSPYSTFYLGQVFENDGGERGPVALFLAPRSAFTVLDDWHGTMGLRGSGSNTVQFDGGYVPGYLFLPRTNLLEMDVSAGTPGLALHANPLYGGRTHSAFGIEFAGAPLGAALGGLELYRELLKSRTTTFPPVTARADDPDFQAWYGSAITKLATAEAALLAAADDYLRFAARGAAGGEPFSRAEDFVLNGITREVCTMAWQAVEGVVFRTAGSSAAREGEAIERLWRDMSQAWSHYFNVIGTWNDREVAREFLHDSASPSAFFDGTQ